MTEFNESMCCVCLQKYCDDFESIFANTSERTELSPLGHFYEELLQLKISTEVQLHYLCSHCNLQLKLFHKFKTKAVASYGLFSQFVATAKEGFTICELPDNTTQADCKIGVRASDIEEIHPLETETSLADISQVKIEQDVIETGDYEVQEFVDFTAVDDSRHAQFGNDGASPMLGLAKQKDEETKDYSCKDCDQVYDKKWLLRKHRGMPLTAAEKQKRYRLRLKNNFEKEEEQKRKARERYQKRKLLIIENSEGEKKLPRQKLRTYKRNERDRDMSKRSKGFIIDTTTTSSGLTTKNPYCVRNKMRRERTKLYIENQDIKEDNEN